MLRSFRRSISILQVPTGLEPIHSTTTTSATTTDGSNIQDVETLTEYKSLEVARMKCLGNPQSMLLVDSPPSVPLYIRKGSLLSIFGSNSLSVNSNLQLISPFSRFLYGRFPSVYQKLHSTSPFSVLISSNTASWLSFFTNSKNMTFAKLVLDGKNDWAILNKHALQVYTGNSLNINMYRLPGKISNKLKKLTGDVPTQLSTGLRKWYKLGYTLVSGRGQVGLVGNGNIYNINIAENEQLLINRHNLLAITVNGPHDLQNCISKHSFPVQETIQPIAKTNFQKYWFPLKSLFSTGKLNSQNFLVGNNQFLKIIGPRNLLIQSDQPHFESKSINLPSFPTNSKVQNKLQDYLSYATVTSDNQVKLRSTPDFQETINLEKK